MTARAPDAALTLVEMLVVLLVIAVASGAAVMGTSALTRDTRVRDEAAALAARLQAAADEALTGGQPLRMEWSASSYGFRRLAEGEWGAAGDARLAAVRNLAAEVALTRPDGIAGPLAIAPDGMGPAVVLRLDGPGGTWTVAFDGLRARALQGQAAP